MTPQNRCPKNGRPDTYSVYDAALRRPISFGQPLRGAKYYIVDSAIKATGIGWKPDNCFRPPEELRAKIKEMLDDLSMQPDAYLLEPRFKLDKPYQLVKSGHDVPTGEYGFALGIVSFSKDRSLASVVVWSSCGQLCGGSQWKVLTRGKKGWEEQTWSRSHLWSVVVKTAMVGQFDFHSHLTINNVAAARNKKLRMKWNAR